MPRSELLTAPAIYLLFITDTDLHINHCNQCLYDMFAISKGCLTGKPISRLKQLLPVGECKKAIKELNENNRLIFKIVHQIAVPVTKFKTEIHWEVNCLNNYKNKLIGYLFTGEVVVLDREENKAMKIFGQSSGNSIETAAMKPVESVLLKNEERYRLILATIGDSAWEHNFENEETFFSEGIYNLSGYEARDLEANIDLWRQCVHPDDQWLIRESDINYKSGLQDNHHFEYRIFHTDGKMKWILDRGAVIESTTDGKAIRIVGIHTDISPEKAIQDHLLIQEQQKKREILEAVLDAQEKEREEIAYELNENVNQVLSISKMMLDSALHNQENVTAVLEIVIENLKELIEEVKIIGQSLSTSTIQLIGLPQAIETLFIKINLAGEISFKLDCSSYKPANEPEPKITLTIFRIAQEAIINIIKHSGATHANIALGSGQKYISIEISDNGHGFDTHASKKGLGLINMFNRVESYNGMVELKSPSEGGCCLKVIIPFAVSDK